MGSEGECKEERGGAPRGLATPPPAPPGSRCDDPPGSRCDDPLTLPSSCRAEKRIFSSGTLIAERPVAHGRSAFRCLSSDA